MQFTARLNTKEVLTSMARLWFLMRPSVHTYTNGDCICIPVGADEAAIEMLYGQKRMLTCPVHLDGELEPQSTGGGEGGKEKGGEEADPTMSQLSEGGRLLDSLMHSSQ